MSNVGYVALSRRIALAAELDAVANNVANADTTGFRREDALFSEYISALDEAPSLSQTRLAGRNLDRAQGALVATGAPFDLAIDGEGYFSVQTPGGERLTRNGAFLLSAEGELVTADGHALSGEGGAAITIPAGAASIVIAADGTVSADGAAIGKVAIVDAAPQTLARQGATLFRATIAPTAVEGARVRQGFVEASNVNAVLEISRLIEVQRAFEINLQLENDDHERIRRAIERVAGRG